MLRQLQDLRLGAFYDVYPHVVYQELFQLESVLYCLRGADPLGDHLCETSGAVLEWFEQESPVCKLQGSDLSDEAL